MSKEMQQWQAVGRRKSAVARVYLRPGNGKITVNGRAFEEYLPGGSRRQHVMQPLVLTETTSDFDIVVTVKGGGLTGQAGAMRHGITRALIEYNAELRGALKRAGYVTRDAREVERKKYGQPGARKRFQFSKR